MQPWGELRVERSTLLKAPGSEHRAIAGENVPDRVDRVVDAVRDPATAVLLLGDSGSGKTRLAEEAAYQLQKQHGDLLDVLMLPIPDDGIYDTEPSFESQFLTFWGIEDSAPTVRRAGSEALARRLLDAFEQTADGRDAVIVARSIDRYPPSLATPMIALLGLKRVRLIATASKVCGVAERLLRRPKVQSISIGPLTYVEGEELIKKALGVEWIEFDTLRRWFEMTNGGAFSLILLAHSLDRRGLLRRDGGLLAEMHATENVPEEYFDYLAEVCSPEEMRTLEEVAAIEPICEPVLLGELDPSHLQSLVTEGVIGSEPHRDGAMVLRVRHPLLAEAVRRRMPVSRLNELRDDAYRLLEHERGRRDPRDTPDALTRLIQLGLDTGRSMSLDWLSAALERGDRGPRKTLMRRIASAITEHPDASTEQIATALVAGSRVARRIGERGEMIRVCEQMEEMLDKPGKRDQIPQHLSVQMRIEIAKHLTLERGRLREALAMLTAVEKEALPREVELAEQARAARVLLLGSSGRLRLAVQEAPDVNEHGGMTLEWARTESRVITALVLVQRGEFEAAVRLSEESLIFSELGARGPSPVIWRLRLTTFIAQLLSGELASAERHLEDTLSDVLAVPGDNPFIEFELALLAVSEGRWREAQQRASRMLDRLRTRDLFGISPMISAIVAFSAAALGDRHVARAAIRAAEIPQPGGASIMRGIVRIFTLEARHWLREHDLESVAQQTIEWAKQEDLPYIELRAMRVLADVQGGIDPSALGRARRLATRVDAPMGIALLDCLEAVSAGETGDVPANRLLAELGVWQPLPRASMLSPREREIALLASLGYSSRWIATRFHLSPRTVDAHLRNVFTKLGVTNRDDLRMYAGDELVLDPDLD